MCGRFILGESKWAGYHAALSSLSPPETRISHNIKPTQSVPVVAQNGDQLQVLQARWWLVPDWFEGGEKAWAYPTFNARIETAASKPAFRDAWTHSRCLIPATGYYEWTGGKGAKQPWFIGLKSNLPVFFFAGLLARGAQGHASCTILTRAARPQLAHLHARTPVILGDDELLPWLDAERSDQDLRDTLGTAQDGNFRFHRVAKFGRDDDGPELIEEDGFDF